MRPLVFAFAFSLVSLSCSDDPTTLVDPTTPVDEDMGMDVSFENDMEDDVDDSPILDGEPLPDNRNYIGQLPQKPASPAGQALYELAEAYCTRVIACRTDANVVRFATAKSISSVADCLVDYLFRHSVADYEAAVAAGTSVLGASSTCVNAIEDLSCEAVPDAFEAVNASVSECHSVFAGTEGAGACASTAECGPGFFCDRFAANGCGGQCILARDSRSVCEGVVCGAGQVCDENNACTDLPTSGQPCGVEDLCATNLFCDDFGICKPVTLGFQVGQTCDFSTNVCALGLFCLSNSQGIGTWQELRASGACFSDVLPSGCNMGTSCQDGVCLPKKSNSSCSLGVDCQSGWCIDGQCVDPGLACTN